MRDIRGKKRKTKQKGLGKRGRSQKGEQRGKERVIVQKNKGKRKGWKE